jgi:hypothetical protein
MLQLLLLVVHTVAGREIPASEHSSRLVQVSVVVEEGGGQVQVAAGHLHLNLGRVAGSQLLSRLLAEEVVAEAEELLGGSLYAGRLEGEPGCEAHAFLEADQVKTASVFCPGLLWVLEGGRDGEATLHRRPQISAAGGNREEVQQDQKACTIFIHTDPFMWRHLVAKNQHPRRAALQMMLDHVLAADRFYRRSLGIRLLLAGWQVDDDSNCLDEVVEEEEDKEWVPDYSKEYEDYWEEYQQYSADQLQLYQDFINDEEYEDDSWREGDWEATLQILSNPTNRSEEPSLVEHPTLLLNLEEESTQLHGEADLEVVDADGNCYESIDGVVDVGKAFCSRFPSTSSGKLLNMFSTVDHSKFCIAHLWTYRDLDVVGLADSPTEGAAGLSGFCAHYDPVCSIGFNTGLISFRHRGKQLSVVDSQDTFLHELGHSLGAGHDPAGRDCSNADSGAHYLMWAGAVSTGQVVRELSPCSLEEINSALGGFPDSCLEGGRSKMMDETSNSSLPVPTPTPQPSDPPTDSTMSPGSSTTPQPSTSPPCQAALVEKQLSAFTGYVRDLWHLQEEGHLRKTLGSLQRKLQKVAPRFLKLRRRRDSARMKGLIERAIGSVEMVEMVEGLDELSIWLARRVTRLARAINPCFVN